MLLAVQRQGFALQFAAPELQRDPEAEDYDLIDQSP